MYALVTGCLPYRSAMFDDGPNENYVGSAKMLEIHDRLRDCTVRFGRSWTRLDEAKDFCRYLMEVDVDMRPTAEQALRHPWMAGFEKAKPVQTAGTTKLTFWGRTKVINHAPVLPML
jgi:serine/threonine protein kinase